MTSTIERPVESPNDDTPNKKKPRYTIKQKVVAGLAATAVAVGGGFLIKAGVDSANQPSKPVAEAPLDPTAQPEVTPKPEVTAVPETKFEGVVNYEALTVDWENKDKAAKDAACAEFFANNKPNTDIVAVNTLTGPQIVEWYNAHLNIVWALDLDESNPDNQIAASNIVDCLTSPHSDGQPSRDQIKEGLHFSTPSFDFPPVTMTPDSVTKYSAGIFATQDSAGVEWLAFSIQGTVTDGLNTLMETAYEWDGSPTFPSFRQVIQNKSGNPAFTYGEIAPIVVAQ